MSFKIIPLTIYILFYFISDTAWCNDLLNTSCVSSQCHTNMAEGANTHPTDSKCISCHLVVNSPHPDKDVVNFSLQAETCITCHTKVVNYNYLHPPVAAGMCTACHSAHGDKDKDLIPEESGVICYDCHDSVVKQNDTVLHGEVSTDQCTSCHTVHGSFFTNLLVDQYSLSFLNDYQKEHYALCFRCHTIDLLLHPKTSYNTKFRDNKTNLHYLHVNRKSKGRSCQACHKTHASSLPHLMAKKVSFGNWQMPVNFQKTEFGGSCSPGCHQPASYDRRRRK